MRIRKLGKDQLIIFCEFIKVERKILYNSDKSRCDIIEIVDVL